MKLQALHAIKDSFRVHNKNNQKILQVKSLITEPNSPVSPNLVLRKKTSIDPTAPKLQFSEVNELIKNQLGVYETNRLLKEVPAYDEQHVSFREIEAGIKEVLRYDLEDCIRIGF